MSQAVLDSSRQIWLAGLGAFARAQAEGMKVFETLVKQGEVLENKTKRAASDTAAAARGAAEGLARIAGQRDVPYLKASAAQATGAVRLASGDPGGALSSLREAWTLWQQLEAPLESARSRVLIARACEQVGDADAAKLHLDAALAAFERLGANAELARLGGGAGDSGPAAALSERERQVLGLVAAGKTNRQIASQLGISEHTVARHVSSIFNKIGVGSRTAASAFAFEHRLV